MSMKYIVAIVRPDVTEALEQRLMAIGIKRLTVSEVKGLGGYVDLLSRDRMSEHANVEIVAPESKLEAITSAIIDVAHTGEPGDGIVAVMPVEKVYRIRSEALPEDS